MNWELSRPFAGLGTAECRQAPDDGPLPPTVRGRRQDFIGAGGVCASASRVGLSRCTAPDRSPRAALADRPLPVCRACRVLLVPARRRAECSPQEASDADGPGRRDSPSLARGARSRTSPPRLRRVPFRRVCAVVAQTIDEQWPDRPQRPAGARRGGCFRRWGVFPSPDPEQSPSSCRQPRQPSTQATTGTACCAKVRNVAAAGALLTVPPQHVPSAGRYLPKRPVTAEDRADRGRVQPRRPPHR